MLRLISRDSSDMHCSVLLHRLHNCLVLCDRLYKPVLRAGQAQDCLFPDLQSRRYECDMLYNRCRRYGSGRQVLFHLPGGGLSVCDIPRRFRLLWHLRLHSC